MLAVSDTSPISNLTSIGHLDLLRSQFGSIQIPGAVATELSAHPSPSASAGIQAALRKGWIQTTTVRQSELPNLLSLQLDRGEAEAIALAIDLRADVILMDEQEGRALPAQAGLRVTGVLGILLRAKRSGQIASVKAEIASLREKAHFFLSRSMEAKIIAAAANSDFQRGKIWVFRSREKKSRNLRKWERRVKNILNRFPVGVGASPALLGAWQAAVLLCAVAPMPAASQAIPEFFGTYAVVDGKLAAMTGAWHIYPKPNQPPGLQFPNDVRDNRECFRFRRRGSAFSGLRRCRCGGERES
jgi:predicted nucleic acid-binding protein